VSEDIYSRSRVDRLISSQGDSRRTQRPLRPAKKGSAMADGGAKVPNLGSEGNAPIRRPWQGFIPARIRRSLHTSFLIGEQHPTVNV